MKRDKALFSALEAALPPRSIYGARRMPNQCACVDQCSRRVDYKGNMRLECCVREAHETTALGVDIVSDRSRKRRAARKRSAAQENPRCPRSATRKAAQKNETKRPKRQRSLLNLELSLNDVLVEPVSLLDVPRECGEAWSGDTPLDISIKKALTDISTAAKHTRYQYTDTVTVRPIYGMGYSEENLSAPSRTSSEQRV